MWQGLLRASPKRWCIVFEVKHGHLSHIENYCALCSDYLHSLKEARYPLVGIQLLSGGLRYYGILRDCILKDLEYLLQRWGIGGRLHDRNVERSKWRTI
jgi:hypothetical protein